MKLVVTISLFIFFFLFDSTAQTYSNKVVGKKKKSEIDSLKVSEYPYMLPILGEKVTQLGFDLPYSAGLSVQYLYQKSELIISNLNVGFNHGEMFNLDQIVRFNSTSATTNGINVRPDFWLFPFLNVYGILAKSSNRTNVDFGVYIPGNIEVNDENLDWSWQNIMDVQTEANFDATTSGFGFTPTVGVGGGFLALDMNWTWTDIPELEKPAKVFIFGPRLGKSFQFGKPEQNIAIWAGAFRVKMNRATSGSLLINDVLPGLDDKIQTGLEKVEENQQMVNDWWDSLLPPQQQNPVNKAKKAAADKALEVAGGALDAASRAESVQYNLDKKQKHMWNFLLGSQYQMNKHWMLRAEVGILGGRQQFIGGLQYRFGL